MQLYDLQAKNADGRTYYWAVLDCLEGKHFTIKNASCEALIWAFLSEKYNLNRLSVTIRFKLFYNGNIEQPNLQMIPKKYQKYFQTNN